MGGSTMAVSPRARFEIFKRDDFTCRYCGRKSPEVVLEVDHIIPRADGGSDDEMNLLTSCWQCNRGKSDVPLSVIMTGEEPHDKAIEFLERQRQLNEYNTVIERDRHRRDNEAWELIEYWLENGGNVLIEDDGTRTIGRQDFNWLFGALKWCPREVIRGFMDAAAQRNMRKNFKYVAGCCRNWRYEHTAATEPIEKDY